MSIKNLISRLQKTRRSLEDVSLLKTLYYNFKYKLFTLPILIYPNVHFHISPKAKIIYRGGRLKVGYRWPNSRFKPTEFVISDNAEIEINDDFLILTGCSVIVDLDAKLSLGRGGLNLCSRVAVFNSVTIGKNVWISENVTIRDSDNHRISGSKSTAPIVIGNNVLIGINATILKGVTIGDGAMIGAGSLVNKNVSPKTLVGGVPAKKIRENIQWNL